ncbi:hypothetical protein PG987_007834 [Apiospora arundinis]
MQPGSQPHPWNAYRANWRGMPYRAGGSPLIRLALFGAGTYLISKWVVRNELREQGLQQQPPQQQARCVDCNNKIELARDNKRS